MVADSLVVVELPENSEKGSAGQGICALAAESGEISRANIREEKTKLTATMRCASQ